MNYQVALIQDGVVFGDTIICLSSDIYTIEHIDVRFMNYL